MPATVISWYKHPVFWMRAQFQNQLTEVKEEYEYYLLIEKKKEKNYFLMVFPKLDSFKY